MTENQSSQSHEHATGNQPENTPKSGDEQGDVLSIIAQVEDRLARLRSASQESGAALETIRQKQDQLEQREQAVAGLEQEIEKRRNELDGLQNSLNEDRAAVEAHALELNEQSDQCAKHEASLNAQRAAIEAQAADMKDRQAELQKQLSEVTMQRQAIENDRQQLNRDRIQLDEQCAARENELAGARAAFEEQERRASANHAQAVNDLTRQLHESHEQAQTLQSELEALRSNIDQEREQAEERISSLEEELNSLRDHEDQQARQLEIAKSKLVNLAKAFEEQTRQIESVGNSNDAVEQRDQTISELNDEITRRDQAIEHISEHLKKLKNDLDEKSHALDEIHAQLESRDDEIARLGEQIESQSDAPSTPSMHGDTRTAEFLEHRRRRLEVMRRAIIDRSKRLNKARDVVRKQVHEVKASQDDRQTLIEVRQNLERAEQRMVSRWARSTTITQLFLLVLTLALLGMGSYFGAMTFWPTEYTAHATIAARGRPGFPLTQKQVNLWQTVHENMLMSDSVIESTAQRLDQRGYKDLAQPAYLKTFLESHLLSASPEPGTISLQLNATGRDEAQRILETFSIALVSKSNSERGRRTDGATTNLTDPAQTDPLPIKDDRNQVAGIAFSASAGVLFLIGLPIYIRLRRSPRLFDESNDLFEPLLDESRWKEITQNGSANGQHIIQ